MIRSILADGERYRATDAFRAIHRLAELRRACESGVWSRVRGLFLPTAPGHPRIDEVLADPIASNARLGRYTTFANLLNMCALAVPSGLRSDGLPFGVTFLGPWGKDAFLLALGSAYHGAVGGNVGATHWPLPAEDEVPSELLCGVCAHRGRRCSSRRRAAQLSVDRPGRRIRAPHSHGAPLSTLCVAGDGAAKAGPRSRGSRRRARPSRDRSLEALAHRDRRKFHGRGRRAFGRLGR